MTESRVLIVDDDPALLQALPETVRLRMSDVTADTCDSARAALERIAVTDYDAIICDIKMPGMDGLALLSEIRKRRPDTPTLLITGHGEHDLAVQALRGGAYDFIQKPIERSYFIASLRRAIQTRQLSRQVGLQQRALEQHAIELEQTVQMRTRELLEANQAKDRMLAARDQALAEARAAQRRLAFLVEAGTLLSSSRDEAVMLQSVARLSVPMLGDWCAFHMPEVHADQEMSFGSVAVAYASTMPEERIHQIMAACSDPTGLKLLAKVLHSGRPAMGGDLPGGTFIESESEDEGPQWLRELDLHAGILVPLVARGQTLGVISFLSAQSARRYADEDFALAEALARRVALAVDNVRLYRQAQQAIQLRDQFLTIASHELRTPLTSVLGYTDMLQRRIARSGTLVDRDYRALQIIGEQARRLNRLISTLLDISRLELGQFTIQRTLLDLHAVARRVVEQIQPALDHHRLEFRSPAHGEPVLIEGDEMRLEQVLQNLLQNAIKYSPAGGTIRVELERQDGMACVTVRDQGIGIPQEALPHLFSRFYRAPNADESHISGMGIGLYVVKEVITRLGGDITVASREAEGSTFTIRLPLADDLLDEGED